MKIGPTDEAIEYVYQHFSKMVPKMNRYKVIAKFLGYEGDPVNCIEEKIIAKDSQDAVTIFLNYPAVINSMQIKLRSAQFVGFEVEEMTVQLKYYVSADRSCEVFKRPNSGMVARFNNKFDAEEYAAFKNARESQ